MPIVQTLVTSFKKESWQGIHNLETDVLKIALYTGAVTLDANTTTYSTTNEASGAGYTGASFITRGALIYNSSKANRAIAVLDFGADKTAVGTFTVVMPANTVSTALLRFA